jgi:hypothetical protein
MHKYQSAMAHYITDHLAILSQIPEHFSPFPWLWHQGWKKNFWSSKITDKFLKKKAGSHCWPLKLRCASTPNMIISNAYHENDLKGRTHTDTSQDYEYTDWNAWKYLSINLRIKWKMQKCCNHLKLNIRKAGDNQQTQLSASKTKLCSKSTLKGFLCLQIKVIFL